MKAILTFAFIFFTFSFLSSQSNIQQSLSVNGSGAAADPSAQLDVSATDKGMLVPRLTTAQRTAIASPATGLLVFDTDTGGFWFFNGTAWVDLASPNTLADADGDTKIQVEESADEDIIRFDLGGVESMVLGRNAAGTPQMEMSHASNNLFIGTAVGDSITTGISNTASGSNSFSLNKSGSFNTATGHFALTSNTEGDANSAYGAGSLRNNTTGDFNTAFGHSALAGAPVFYNTGGFNTAVGRSTLNFNRVGNENTAVGSGALYFNDSGNCNTAIGVNALLFNTGGNNNTANGKEALFKNTGGINNTANGYRALFSNTIGYYNTASGAGALNSNTTGSSNVAVGVSALFNNTDRSNLVAVGDSALYNNGVGASGNFEAHRNTAIGSKALFSNTTGYWNTATGSFALSSNTTGITNTATGSFALSSNTTGGDNTATGRQTLGFNTSGNFNTANGAMALSSNSIGNRNTAIGFQALFANTTGDNNTANGFHGLYENTTGYDNTANGYQALFNNTTGYQNTGNGRNALVTNTVGTNNTADGFSAGSLNDDSFYCTFLGNDADQTITILTNNSMALGSDSRITASHQVRIGNSSVSSIGGYAPWTDVSDRRFKRNLQEDVPGLGFILKLRPVTYNLDAHGLAAHLQEDRIEGFEKGNSEAPQKPDALALQGREAKSSIRYTGFVAQEVEQTAQSIGYDFSGVDKPQSEEGLYGLRYSEFVVPLVKAVQELADRADGQQALIELGNSEIRELKAELGAKDAEINALKSQLDKITAALAGAGIAVEK